MARSWLPWQRTGGAAYAVIWQDGGQPSWEAAWAHLRAPARTLYLKRLLTPGHGWQPEGIAFDGVANDVSEALIRAGFVQRARGRGQKEFLVRAPDAEAFAERLRTIRAMNFLHNEKSSIHSYAFYELQHPSLNTDLAAVFRIAGLKRSRPMDSGLDTIVRHHQWPEWVAKKLGDSSAALLLDRLTVAEKPVPLLELVGSVADRPEDSVRLALGRLILHLAVFEDIDDGTGQLVAGLLPQVRTRLAASKKDRVCPPLVRCEQPAQQGPEGAVVLNDLRSFLLELAAGPVPIRQDGKIYQKELSRFVTGLEPLPEWFTTATSINGETRIETALNLARQHALVVEDQTKSRPQILLSPAGQNWPGRSARQQIQMLYSSYQALPRMHFGYEGDYNLLGIAVGAVPIDSKFNEAAFPWSLAPKQVHALRHAVYAALQQLTPGVYYTLDSVSAHLSFRANNPLLLGRDPLHVAISWYGQRLAPFEDQAEQAAQDLFRALFASRLLLLGGARAGLDAGGALVVALQPLQQFYFGHDIADNEFPGLPVEHTRVVVQPDFSVIVIGGPSLAAAELAPFCQRGKGHAGEAAAIFKLTRDSVVNAVMQGLTETEILGRLRRHASTELPKNILVQVREWCQWVRPIEPADLIAFPCPDRITADRVLAALGRRGQRLNDTTIAIARHLFSSADRAKLRKAGILLVDAGPSDLQPANLRRGG